MQFDSEYFVWEDDWGVYFTNWKTLGDLSKETCAYMNTTDGFWYHSSCDKQKLSYVCKYSTGEWRQKHSLKFVYIMFHALRVKKGFQSNS